MSYLRVAQFEIKVEQGNLKPFKFNGTQAKFLLENGDDIVSSVDSRKETRAFWQVKQLGKQY